MSSVFLILLGLRHKQITQHYSIFFTDRTGSCRPGQFAYAPDLSLRNDRGIKKKNGLAAKGCQGLRRKKPQVLLGSRPGAYKM